MLNTETKYSYNDIAIVPAIYSTIEHRNECNPYDEDGNLPIFASPMSTVVCEENIEIFEKNHIIPIVPRNISYDKRIVYIKKGKWVAFGLQEFKETFIDNDWDIEMYPKPKALIDIANGHMRSMHLIVKEAKQKYGMENIIIMVGNIANAETYRVLADCGADYIRISIGTGGGCLSSSNLGVHMPIASLIDDIYNIKEERYDNWQHCPKVIADGGVRNFSDVIKALALGADYVMCGSIFAQLIESAAPTSLINENDETIPINQFFSTISTNDDGTFNVVLKDAYGIKEYNSVKINKTFYGMASKQGQIAINGKKTKTSEGLMKILNATTKIDKWVDNMKSYLQSAMSYTDCVALNEFNPDNVDCVVISTQTKESINK